MFTYMEIFTKNCIICGSKDKVEDFPQLCASCGWESEFIYGTEPNFYLDAVRKSEKLRQEALHRVSCLEAEINILEQKIQEKRFAEKTNAEHLIAIEKKIEKLKTNDDSRKKEFFLEMSIEDLKTKVEYFEDRLILMEDTLLIKQGKLSEIVCLVDEGFLKVDLSNFSSLETIPDLAIGFCHNPFFLLENADFVIRIRLNGEMKNENPISYQLPVEFTGKNIWFRIGSFSKLNSLYLIKY